MLSAVVYAGATGVAQALPVGAHPIPTWQTNGRVNVILQSKNTVYIGGQFSSVRPAGSPAGTGEVTRNHVAAFNLSTGALLPFDPNTNGAVRAMRLVRSTMYLGGAFTQVGGSGHQRVAAVDAKTGAAIAGWKAAASGEVFALMSKGTTLYIGGSFGTVDGVARSNLAGVTLATGALTGWSPSADAMVRGMRLVDAKTRLVLGGWFAHVNGSSQNHLAAVDPSTGATMTWQSHPGYPALGLASDANGVYVAGAGGGGNFSGYDPTTGHQLWQGGTNGNVQAIGVVGGIVYVGGHFTTYCGPQGGQHTCTTPTSRDKLLSVDEHSGALQGWNPSANSILGVFALTGDASNGDLFAGGDFTSIGQRKQQGFAQFTP